MIEEQSYLDRLADKAALRSYLSDRLGSAESVDIARHMEGHSNETLFIIWDDREFVLRRPPPGETADSAHDVLREWQIMDKIQNTDVPVPETIHACDDESVIGSEFYLMAFEAGDVLRDEEPSRFADAEYRERIGQELIDTLATIHSLDYGALGLDDFGYPDGFTERQIDRWQKQINWASKVTQAERNVPVLDTIGEWLQANVPANYQHTLIHGDYKLDNVLFKPDQSPTIGAILDWELSTIGDPFTDLGWMLLFWHEKCDPEPAMPDLMQTFTARNGYLTKDNLIDRYEQSTGFKFRNRLFYQVLAAYKMAGLGEMFYRRYLEDNAADSLYPQMEEGVPKLAEQTLSIIKDRGNL